jgi:glycosyltransferase involved in cell wall biosynthesis
MKILMLLEGTDFPPDIRVEKEARALLAAGHTVVLLCENLSNRPRREQWQGIEIIRLPTLAPRAYRWRRMLMFLTLRDQRWETALAAAIRAHKPDVLHVHDLLYVGPALRVARRYQLPVIADLHENYPALVDIRHETATAWYQAISRFIYSSARLRHYERQVLPHCDQVVVVVAEAADRIAAEAGVPRDRITVVGNSEDMVEAESLAQQAVELPPTALRLLYVGGFGIHRGLEVVIAALPAICARVPSAEFVVVGSGADRAKLEALAAQVGVAGAVRFEGQQPFARVHGYIVASDICLVPHIANAHTDSTIPHKLFQYMYMAKPVIVSSARPLARIVREHHAGAVFTSGDAASLAEAVFSLLDPAQRQAAGNRGRQAVLDCYNWQRDAQTLTALYAKLAKPRQGAPRQGAA